MMLLLHDLSIATSQIMSKNSSSTITLAPPVKTADEGFAVTDSPVARTKGRSYQIRVTLASIFIVLLMFELFARFLVALGDPVQFCDSEFDSKWQIASHVQNPKTPQIFVLGTSYSERAVYSELITERLQKQGIDVNITNLASSGSFAKDWLFQLKTALKHSSSCKAVVIEVSKMGFLLPPSTNEVYRKELLDSYLSFLLAEPKNPKELLIACLNTVSYAFRYRGYLKSLTSEMPINMLSGDAGRKNWVNTATHCEFSKSGWGPGYNFVTAEALEFSKSERTKTVELFLQQLDRKQMPYGSIKSAVEFCRKENIPVIFLWLPVHPEFDRWYTETTKISAEQFKNVILREAKACNAKLIDVHSFSDQSSFHDGDHVNAMGAVKVSDTIAQLLSGPEFAQLLKPQKQ